MRKTGIAKAAAAALLATMCLSAPVLAETKSVTVAMRNVPKTTAVSVAKGDKVKIRAKYGKKVIKASKLHFKSSKPKKVSVRRNIATAKKYGTSVIAVSYGGKTAKIRITVRKKAAPVTSAVTDTGLDAVPDNGTGQAEYSAPAAVLMPVADVDGATVTKPDAKHVHAHFPSRITAKATCTAPAKVEYKCACGDTVIRETAGPREHRFVPVSSGNGETLSECTVCGVTKTEVNGNCEHVWVPDTAQVSTAIAYETKDGITIAHESGCEMSVHCSICREKYPNSINAAYADSVYTGQPA